AEVDVLVTIDVTDNSSLRRLYEDRKGAGPFDHPVHGHARPHGATCLFERPRRRGVSVDEELSLGSRRFFEARPIQSAVASARMEDLPEFRADEVGHSNNIPRSPPLGKGGRAS